VLNPKKFKLCQAVKNASAIKWQPTNAKKDFAKTVIKRSKLLPYRYFASGTAPLRGALGVYS
jgi:hypothetical protein